MELKDIVAIILKIMPAVFVRSANPRPEPEYNARDVKMPRQIIIPASSYTTNCGAPGGIADGSAYANLGAEENVIAERCGLAAAAVRFHDTQNTGCDCGQVRRPRGGPNGQRRLWG